MNLARHARSFILSEMPESPWSRSIARRSGWFERVPGCSSSWSRLSSARACGHAAVTSSTRSSGMCWFVVDDGLQQFSDLDEEPLESARVVIGPFGWRRSVIAICQTPIGDLLGPQSNSQPGLDRTVERTVNLVRACTPMLADRRRFNLVRRHSAPSMTRGGSPYGRNGRNRRNGRNGRIAGQQVRGQGTATCAPGGFSTRISDGSPQRDRHLDRTDLPPPPQTSRTRPIDPCRVRDHHDHTCRAGSLTQPVTRSCSSPSCPFGDRRRPSRACPGGDGLNTTYASAPVSVTQ
jgi:hypothetical protein